MKKIAQLIKKNLNAIRIEKSIELAKYYKDNIISLSGQIKFIFKKLEIRDILLSVKELKQFDDKEMNLLLGKNVDVIKNALESDKTLEAIDAANERYHFCLLLNFENEDEKKRVIDLCKNYLKDLILHAKNNLEYFAMSFKHEVADEEVVYQSLHQTYLEMMQLLYYNIAAMNVDVKKKYFTHAIWLYNRWKQRSLQDENNEKEYNNSLIEKNTCVGLNK